MGQPGRGLDRVDPWRGRLWLVAGIRLILGSGDGDVGATVGPTGDLRLYLSDDVALGVEYDLQCARPDEKRMVALTPELATYS